MVGYGRIAAYPDALLHDSFGERGARIGILVAVLHLLLYFTAPALAVLAKFDVYTLLVARTSPSCQAG